MQDEGSRFAVLNTDNYVEKMEEQIHRSSFDKLGSAEFKQKVTDWIEKWSDKIHENWKKFIKPDNCKAIKMYGMVKTHKDDNPVRVITSACNTSIENLSILIEKTCLVTSLMLFTSFLIRTVETSLLVQLMISRL